MIRWVLLLSILFGVLSQNSLALETENMSLYQVEEAVPSQGKLDRELAAQRALLRVVSRVTGTLAGMEHPLVKAALPRAHQMLSDFEYLAENDEEGNRQWLIRFRFQAERIDSLLRQADLPRWAERRPRVLLWFLVDTIDGQHIVYESDYKMSPLVLERFSERAVPVQLPIGDLDDSLALAPAELWQLSQNHVLSASARYPGTVVLAGRATQVSDGSWIGSWMSFFDIKASYRDIRVASLEEILDQGVDMVASQMSARYAIRSSKGESAPVYVQLAGVDNPSAYIEMLKFWQGLNAIRDVQVVQIEGAGLLLGLQIDGELQQLQAVLDLEGRLESISHASQQSAQTADLFYRWKGESW